MSAKLASGSEVVPGWSRPNPSTCEARPGPPTTSLPLSELSEGPSAAVPWPFITLRSGPVKVPTGVLEFALDSTVRISSSEMLRAAAATGST